MIYGFSLDFLFCFCGILRQIVILINYSFYLCFTTWLRIICWQQASHVEIYVLSINANNQVR